MNEKGFTNARKSLDGMPADGGILSGRKFVGVDSQLTISFLQFATVGSRLVVLFLRW